MRKNKLVLGQSIFELVIAIGVVTVVLVALVALIATVQRNSTASKNRAQATRLMLEAQEWIRTERDSDWSAFYARTNTASWCLVNLSWNNSGACGTNEYVVDQPFRRQVDFVQTTANLELKSAVKVFWTDSQGNHEITSETILTNWKNR